MPAPAPTDRFARIGNNLSADFVNTVYAPDHADGALRSAKDVIDFLIATNVVAAAGAAAIRLRLANPDDAARFLARALHVRAAVSDALHAIEQGRALDAGSLETINDILASDAGFDRLDHRRGTAYALTYHRVRPDLDHVFAPIARDAARLLSTPGVPVRHCAGAGCVRHFYDDSRTGRRRWCEMAICGNRAKVAAFTARRAGSDRV